ncbi:MAG TPA: dihydroxyacetone kinase phosphoryl donor subunit DhaM [Pseudonocardiaceae bacterium]|nr:dihydroxyacetone kinase phosphoryl donor subunit DhaM [Pseudonocardiaceae bacterium]
MTVGLVVVSHSATLAAGVVELAAQMAPGVPIIPAGGMPDGGLGTDFAAVTAAVTAADQGDGVVLLFDLGSAQMTADLVVESLADPDRAVVADAPLVEGAVAAAVAAAGGASMADVAAAASGSAAAAVSSPGPADEAEIELTNEIGLHARPAAQLARSLTGVTADVTVRFGDQTSDARSVLGLLGLGARKGDRLVVSARGEQASEALRRIRQLADDNFGE